MYKYLLIFLFICTSCYAGVDFDGTDDVVSLPVSSVVFNAGNPFSFSCWVYWGKSGANVIEYIYSGSRPWSGKIALQHTWGYIWVQSDGDTSIHVDSNDAAVPLNTWTHITVTWDGSVTSTNIKIYVNAALIGHQNDVNGINLSSDTGVKYLGNGNAGTYPFDGKINEVAIWNSVLSTTEIQLLAKSKVKGLPLQIRPANLVMYLPMDETADGASGDGVTFVDRSGNSSDGTGDDGAGDAGLTGKGEEVLSYP